MARDVDVDVATDGPFFDARVYRAMANYCDAAEAAIADEGTTLVVAGTAVFRNPTGYYRSRVHSERGDSEHRVTDGGVVYGPWIEGDGSRNRSSSFKGYRLWRLAAQQLQSRADQVADRELARHVDRMA